ncbi:hypothetical protein L596_028892 [Steinernema carpocapsae]|uniref:Uncharacterized protein n=1 Tax=Steinernema carpocapsae TaxID=34508 RepID=A0A4U5LZS5_STECR|nr:hypothetical protein L596_028892 [Steinernema carpocapsae]
MFSDSSCEVLFSNCSFDMTPQLCLIDHKTQSAFRNARSDVQQTVNLKSLLAQAKGRPRSQRTVAVDPAHSSRLVFSILSLVFASISAFDSPI